MPMLQEAAPLASSSAFGLKLALPDWYPKFHPSRQRSSCFPTKTMKHSFALVQEHPWVNSCDSSGSRSFHPPM